MDSAHTREDATNAPSYDSSDEWEIGLGNLIIDLDADLEKDGHHDGTATHLDASPMKVGKMKIKRKVSSSATKCEGVSPITVRKDSNASTGSSTPEDPSSAYSSPDRSGRLLEEKSGKPVKSVTPGAQTGGCSIGTHKRDANPGIIKQDKIPNVISIKPIVPSILQTKPGQLAAPQNINPIPSVVTTPSTGTPTKPSVTQAGEGKQLKSGSKGQEEGEGEELAAKKAKMEKGDGKGEVGKKSGEPTVTGRKHGGKKTKTDKPLRQSVGVDTMDIGVATEPECIGPCEPGTSVNLEGIVWHETDQGVLVVNVTWRNKTYVGTLMDCTRHDWAAPRFCDSPTSDMESRGKGGGRPKRGRNSNSSSDLSNYTETRSSIHSKLRNSTKGRRGSNASNGTRTPPCSLESKNAGKRKTKESEVEELVQTNKRQKTGTRPSSSASEGRNTPVLIECPQPNCNKKYKHKNGLHYHLSHAHHNNLDKDGNWRERSDEVEDDTKSNASDDSGSATVVPKDKKKDSKEKKDSSKEEEGMDVDKPAESIGDSTTSHVLPSAGAEASVESATDSASQKKGDCPKTREVVKSPKALKTHVDKFTAGMKCLGIPKPKEGKASPSKAPKGDASCDKSVKTLKKPSSSSSDKDLSIFDFNSTSELDEQGTTETTLSTANEKHVNVSVIRPTPETTHVKSEPISPTQFAKVSDHAKGPKQHSSSISSSAGSDLGADGKRIDKDRSKSDKHKKTKHEKVLMKTGKTIRPIAPAPAPSSSAPPPQLVAIPTTLVQNPVAGNCTLTVPSINTVTSKPQVSSVNPSLKPIQPKPITTSSPVSDVGGFPSSLKDKDKKLKPKKKLKSDKEKEREKERLPGVPSDSSKSAKEQPGEQRQKNPLLPAVPETNILKQALTASGIVEPENTDKSKPVGPEPWKRESNKLDAPAEKVAESVLSSPNKPASTAPVSNAAMPQIPKLIPTSSVTGPSNRPPKQPALPLQHSLQQPPVHLQQSQQQPLALTAGMKPSATKPDAVSQERASLNLPVHSSLNKEGPKNAQLLFPPNGGRTGNISPAYSDISEDGVDEHGKQAKSSEAFSFDSAAHVKSQGDSARREGDGGSGSERMPVFHSSAERRGTPEVHASGTAISSKNPHERDEGQKSDGSKDPASQRTPSSSTQSQPTSMPHVYSGGHYPYLHGYVNIDPAYHMHLMASDPQYRQQQERHLDEQRRRMGKYREQEGMDKSGESRNEGPEKRRPIVSLQTEPITPPQIPRHADNKERSRDKDQITKSRHLDFQKKDGSLHSAVGTPESEKHSSSVLLAERQREEMKQFQLYQQKLFEQQRHAEEHRRSAEQECRKKDMDLSKNDAKASEHVDKRTPTPVSRTLTTPTKESGRISSDADKRDSISPLPKGQKSDGKTPEQRKLLEGYPYLQTPYPYGPIPYEPSHSTLQPLVYPAFLHPELHYPPTSSAMAWKSPSEKGRFDSDREQGSSPHSLSSKGGKSPEAHDPPPRALDVLQRHASQYFSPPPPQQKHGSTSRPRTPEKGHTTPGHGSRSSSPAARKTPEMSSSSTSSSSSATISSGREEGRRPTVHQHMHTHQHTHVGMGYPVLQTYDSYVIASQQAAAAAAASASSAALNPYTVRSREKS